MSPSVTYLSFVSLLSPQVLAHNLFLHGLAVTAEFLGWRLSFSFLYLNLLLPRSETTGSDGKLIHTEVLSHFIIQTLIEFLLCARHCAKVCVSH